MCSIIMYEQKRTLKSNKNIVYSCNYHIVWCPKYRRPVLVGDIAQRLKSLLISI